MGPGCICTIVLPTAIPHFEMLPRHGSQLYSRHEGAGQRAYRVGTVSGDIVGVTSVSNEAIPGSPGNNSGSINGSLAVKALPGAPALPRPAQLVPGAYSVK